MRTNYTPTPKPKLRESSGKQIKHDRLELLGYALHANCVDSFGRRWRYRSFPMTSGPVNQFDNLSQVDHYCDQVEQIRRWQQ